MSCTGINKHEGEDIGLYDTVITPKDAQKMFENAPVGPLCQCEVRHLPSTN